MGYNFVADIKDLSSFVYSWCWLSNVRNPTKFRENLNL